MAADETLSVSGDTRKLLDQLREPHEPDDALIRRIAVFYRNARAPRVEVSELLSDEPDNLPERPPESPGTGGSLPGGPAAGRT